ncbi:DNA (cytosine-5-)-methyltransferase [Yasminevirus sp. GU-2018]|uniref:Cytosine-specific methyltransferase n=1 Tax=Yasminevirus sp. GU-2018 TaxID=2420051 RepID=A0A5K0U835_9VIRU|nr:DNA (cytosine-5-)-methyltransferase [Yasminevirus sp. GU-2018]
MTEWKLFDAFAGVGGIRLGFESASKEFKTVYAVDIEKKCKTTYDLNFEDTPLTVGDISKLKISTLPEFDIFTAGFPCQPYSIAGKREALEDKRGKVVYDMLKIIKEKKPKVVFLENVKNFKTINDGEPYKLVTGELEKYGYYIKDAVLNTCELTTIPQNRERIFIVGFLDKNAFSYFEFPDKKEATQNIESYLEDDIADKYYYTEASAIFPKLVDTVVDRGVIYQYRRHYVRENKSGNVPTLTANMGSGGHNCPIIVDDNGIRKLTPKECFKFQGFPDEYELPNLADSVLYKQAGNSVTVELIKKIATNIHCALKYGKIATDYETEMPVVVCKRKIHDQECKIKCVTYSDQDSAKHLVNYHDKFVALNKVIKEINGRKSNISEAFTEGLYCYLTNSVRVLELQSTDKTKKMSGSFDCYNFDDNVTVQVKASTLKSDCTSFGPKSEFDRLVYIDFSDPKNFKLYTIDDKTYFENLTLNKKKGETVGTQKQQGRRPRFSLMKDVILKHKIKPSFTGDINDIEAHFKELAIDIEKFGDGTLVNTTTASSSQNKKTTKVVKSVKDVDEYEDEENCEDQEDNIDDENDTAQSDEDEDVNKTENIKKKGITKNKTTKTVVTLAKKPSVPNKPVLAKPIKKISSKSSKTTKDDEESETDSYNSNDEQEEVEIEQVKITKKVTKIPNVRKEPTKKEQDKKEIVKIVRKATIKK